MGHALPRDGIAADDFPDFTVTLKCDDVELDLFKPNKRGGLRELKKLRFGPTIGHPDQVIRRYYNISRTGERDGIN